MFKLFTAIFKFLITNLRNSKRKENNLNLYICDTSFTFISINYYNRCGIERYNFPDEVNISCKKKIHRPCYDIIVTIFTNNIGHCDIAKCPSTIPDCC